MCLMSYANNKGTDQPAHPRILISTFVVLCVDSIIPIFATSRISRPYLVPVAEQAGLRLKDRLHIHGSDHGSLRFDESWWTVVIRDSTE